MKNRLFRGVVAALLLGVSGCAWFENDPPPPKNSKKTAQERKEEEIRKARRARRDPVDDMFFGIGKKSKAPTFSTDGLNEREQSIVREELRRQDDEMKALRQSHRNFDTSRDKRREWVYGFKTNDWL